MYEDDSGLDEQEESKNNNNTESNNTGSKDFTALFDPLLSDAFFGSLTSNDFSQLSAESILSMLMDAKQQAQHPQQPTQSQPTQSQPQKQRTVLHGVSMSAQALEDDLTVRSVVNLIVMNTPYSSYTLDRYVTPCVVDTTRDDNFDIDNPSRLSMYALEKFNKLPKIDADIETSKFNYIKSLRCVYTISIQDSDIMSNANTTSIGPLVAGNKVVNILESSILYGCLFSAFYNKNATYPESISTSITLEDFAILTEVVSELLSDLRRIRVMAFVGRGAKSTIRKNIRHETELVVEVPVQYYVALPTDKFCSIAFQKYMNEISTDFITKDLKTKYSFK